MIKIVEIVVLFSPLKQPFHYKYTGHNLKIRSNLFTFEAKRLQNFVTNVIYTQRRCCIQLIESIYDILFC